MGLVMAAGLLVLPMTSRAQSEDAAVAEPVPAAERDTAGEPVDPGEDDEIIRAEMEDEDLESAETPGAEQEGPLAGEEEVDPIEDFIHRTKNPVPWFNWGADLRLRQIYMNNAVRLDKSSPTHERNFQRYRARWWAQIKPVEQLEFNLRMVWEARTWPKPKAFEYCDPGEVLFDRLNFTIRKPFDLPITIVGGRQDIALGDRWLVFEGGPLDGSRTIYFDAIRLTADLEEIKTKIDLIYIDQDAEGEHWVSHIKPRDTSMFTGAPGPDARLLSEQDERGAILYVSNYSLPNTQIDGYFIYKNDRSLPTGGNDADIYTFGSRVAHDFNDHWKARAELAGQFGHMNDAGLCALGGNSQLAYHFNDEHKNFLHLDYEYMSGDRPGTDRSEAFDPLWGRWPRFSELYIYTNAGETRVADPTNMHRVAMGWSCAPLKNMTMSTVYHLLFADQNTFRDRAAFSDSGCFRGQLLTWLMRYKFNAHMSAHTVAEFFFPGDYYADSNNDVAMFLRAELVFSW